MTYGINTVRQDRDLHGCLGVTPSSWDKSDALLPFFRCLTRYRMDFSVSFVIVIFLDRYRSKYLLIVRLILSGPNFHTIDPQPISILFLYYK